jgi:hypothetical protein
MENLKVHPKVIQDPREDSLNPQRNVHIYCISSPGLYPRARDSSIRCEEDDWTQVQAPAPPWPERSAIDWELAPDAVWVCMEAVPRVVQGIWFGSPRKILRTDLLTHLLYLDSDILYIDVAGTNIVVLNSTEAANDLLEVRSSLYSGRWSNHSCIRKARF